MKRNLRILLALAALLLSPGLAFAQFSQSVSQKYRTDYATDEVKFSLTEVATTLGTDTATLAGELRTFLSSSKGTNSTGLDFLLVQPDGTETNSYTTSVNGGFWMTLKGYSTSWGTDSCYWYTDLNVSSGEGADDFIIMVGQYPKKFEDGGTGTASYKLTRGGKTATFGIDLTVSPKPVANVEQQFSKLEIVKTVEAVVEQYPRKNSNSVSASVEVPELCSLLGLETEDMVDLIGASVFVRGYDNVGLSWTDSINNDFTSDNGYWWTQLIDESTGNKEEECFNLYTPSGDYASPFYTENFALNSTADTLTFSIGQNSGVCEANQSYNATVYIVNETKAYAVKIVLNVVESPQIDFSEMTEAGREYKQVVKEEGQSGSTYWTVDLDSVASLLGIETADISYYALASEGKLTAEATASSGGFWFNTQSYVCNYGDDDAAMYIDLASDSRLKAGTNGKTAIAAGDSLTSCLYVLGTNSYYVFEVNVKVAANEEIDSVDVDDWKVVETLTYDAELSLQEGSSQSVKTQLDMDAILSALGLSSLDSNSFYTWSTDTIEGWVPSALTNTYTTSATGFWMSENGKYPSKWNTNNAYGLDVDVSSGEVTWRRLRANTDNVDGTTYQGEFFFVNVANGNVVKLIFNIVYVETRETIETVGEEDILIELSEEQMNDDGLYALANDLSKAFEALGMEASEYDSGIWQAQTASGSFKNVSSFGAEETAFNASGAMVDVDAEDAAFSVAYDPEEGTFLGSTLGTEVDEETMYTTKVAFRYENKRYVFNVTLASKEIATAIAAPEAAGESADQAVYDLSGRRLRTNGQSLPRGIYVVGGKKVMVK